MCVISSAADGYYSNTVRSPKEYYVKRDLRSIWWKCINRTFYLRLLDSTWHQWTSILVKILGIDVYHFHQPILCWHTLFVFNLSIDSCKVQLEWQFNGQNNDKCKRISIIDFLGFFWIFLQHYIQFSGFTHFRKSFLWNRGMCGSWRMFVFLLTLCIAQIQILVREHS